MKGSEADRVVQALGRELGPEAPPASLPIPCLHCRPGCAQSLGSLPLGMHSAVYWAWEGSPVPGKRREVGDGSAPRGGLHPLAVQLLLPVPIIRTGDTGRMQTLPFLLSWVKTDMGTDVL